LGDYEKWFTLVELSIVLVIIGLLIGGIISAQSMIQTARVDRYISNLQQYQAITSNFFTNYKQVPGDSNLFIPAGNNNRRIDWSACAGTYAGETNQFWTHLSLAGMTKDTYVAHQPDNCGGTHEDSMSAPENIGLILPVFSKDPLDGIIVRYVNTGFSFESLNGIYSTESISLDAKLDNGDPSNGNFLSYNDDGTGPCDLDSETCNIIHCPVGGEIFAGNHTGLDISSWLP
jgi:prepilin-type N-terminal cleavage/methylation domain-containing protein